MRKVKTVRTTVEVVLSIWERHFHVLSYENRRQFKNHKDAKALTQYSRFQIEHAITMGKAKYLREIYDFLTANETLPAPKNLIHSNTYRYEKKIEHLSTPKIQGSNYICGLWQVHTVGEICTCGRDK